MNIELSNGGSATATTTSTGITSVSVVSSTFQDKNGDTSGTYDFTYNSSEEWEYQSRPITLSDYGISYVGTPSENDVIQISYTAGTWTDYLAVSSIADKYTTDENKIYISEFTS